MVGLSLVETQPCGRGLTTFVFRTPAQLVSPGRAAANQPPSSHPNGSGGAPAPPRAQPNLSAFDDIDLAPSRAVPLGPMQQGQSNGSGAQGAQGSVPLTAEDNRVI